MKKLGVVLLVIAMAIGVMGGGYSIASLAEVSAEKPLRILLRQRIWPSIRMNYWIRIPSKAREQTGPIPTIGE